MSNYIFDTHSHYDDKAFDSDRDEILNGLFEKGIGKVVDVGCRYGIQQNGTGIGRTVRICICGC